jgi:hypothetical protein
MSDTSRIRRGALALGHAAVSPHGSIAEPLEVIRLALVSAGAARKQFPGYRLTRSVGARLELDGTDMIWLSDILGHDLLRSVEGALRPFDYHLRNVINSYDLGTLFNDDGYAPYHHAIRPTGYDFDRDEVIPTGMEKWRADYRALPEFRQMMAASIVWLYRGGKDNVWLRRVPCTWHAADALACLRDEDALEDWARLYALYPGW